MLCILGCDPGLTGALALLELDHDRRVLDLTIEDMPVTAVRVGRATRKLVEPAELCRLIRAFRPDAAYVEAVHSMPAQGVASSFAFGMGFGVLRGVIAALGVPVTYVTPQEWMRIVRLGKGDDVARQRIKQLMPDHAAWFPLKAHHGRADAALIAMAGAQIEKHTGL